jgi:hypothetical protein
VTESRPIWVNLDEQNELASPAWEISVLLDRADHVRAFGSVLPGGQVEERAYALIEGRHFDPHAYLAMRHYVDRDHTRAPVSDRGPDHATDWDSLLGFRDASLNEQELDASAASLEVVECLAAACARLYRGPAAAAVHPADTLEHGGNRAAVAHLLIAVLGSLSLEARLVQLETDTADVHPVVEVWFDGAWHMVETFPAYAAEEGRAVFDSTVAETIADPMRFLSGSAAQRFAQTVRPNYVSLQDNWQWPRPTAAYEVRLEWTARSLHGLYPSGSRRVFKCIGTAPWLPLLPGVGSSVWTMRDRWLSVGPGGALRRSFHLGAPQDIRRLTSRLFLPPADSRLLGEAIAVTLPSTNRWTYRLNGALLDVDRPLTAQLVEIPLGNVNHRALEFSLDLERDPALRGRLLANAQNTLEIVNETSAGPAIPVLLNLDRFRPYSNPIVGAIDRVEQMVRREPLAPSAGTT